MPMWAETEAIFDEGTAKSSCTVVIGSTVLFLGGYRYDRQISQLTLVGLMRIGTLPFGLIQGTCIVVGGTLFLGFGGYNRRSCWSR